MSQLEEQVKSILIENPNIIEDLDQIKYYLILCDEFCKLEAMDRGDMYHLMNRIKDLFKLPVELREPGRA